MCLDTEMQIGTDVTSYLEYKLAASYPAIPARHSIPNITFLSHNSHHIYSALHTKDVEQKLTMSALFFGLITKFSLSFNSHLVTFGLA